MNPELVNAVQTEQTANPSPILHVIGRQPAEHFAAYSRFRPQLLRPGEAGYIRATGFTLVEMLVIIAIVAILAALLLPALEHALSTARQASCSGNQRQIAVALQAYKDDNYGIIPAPGGTVWGSNGEGQQSVPWALFLFRPKYGPVGNQAQMLPGGYMNENERLLLVCPASRSVAYLNSYQPGDWNYRSMGMSYGMYSMRSDVWVVGYDEGAAIITATFYLNNQAKGTWRLYRYKALPRPSNYALIGDTTTQNSNSSFGYNGGTFFSRRFVTNDSGVWLCHDNVANILCADGHVDNGTPDKMDTYENSKYKSGGVLTQGIRKFADEQGNPISLP